MKKNFTRWFALLFTLVIIPGALAPAQTTNVTGETTNAVVSTPEATNAPEAASPPSNTIPVLRIKADQVTAKVSPMLYGLMTEEINYAYEGGLYGELIRNRSFKANPTNAVFWEPYGNAVLALDTNQPLNAALNVSLKLDTSKASKKSPVGIVNGGYWGIALRPNTTYRASFYAKGEHFSGPLTISLVNVPNPSNVTIKVHSLNGKNPEESETAQWRSVAFTNGSTVSTGWVASVNRPGGRFDWYLGGGSSGGIQFRVASATIPKISDKWQKYEVTLTTGNIAPSKDNQLVISTTDSGSFWHRHSAVWLQQVSLFPPTYNNRSNGNRPDLMQLMADIHPKFLRFPGGNYLEGNYIWTRFNWKNTVGDVAGRPGHDNDAWGYWSTDGMGLLEFLNWCEDLNMEPVLAVYAGYSLRRDFVKPGPDLEPYVKDALDEIEYVIGDASTPWGARRAADGHPAPFPLRYIEIGNEDWFDRSGSYDGRFTQFYDAIKAMHPHLQLIATTPVKSRQPDVIDEHFYRSQQEMEAHAHDYDQRPRDGKPKVFVGEWATRVGSPTPNMAGALGDAAWMTGMERNSDLVIMSCYAPLFVNVSDFGKGRSMQWKTDLIGYDALSSYGSPAYYAQKMFSTLHGNEVLATDSQNLPTYAWQPPARRNRGGVDQPAPPPQEVPTLFFDATRDRQSGTIYLKVVNRQGTPQTVKIEISGVAAVEPRGTATVLKANSPEDTNSIQEPTKIIPVTEKTDGLGTDFTREFPPYSITVLGLHAQ
ncbi:MAG TPA: alpha-L-arabinofuranosidase C-terminal domain-containing protein [Candidatus Acidoferrum sp.]|nr:alpha-L-arabinofuranosidase C-terminal domain-containing protein [Candidatus Acidoferrum sp.]